MALDQSQTNSLFTRTDHRRSTNAVALSAFLHLTAGAAIVLLMGISSSLSLPQAQQTLTFLVFAPPRVVPPTAPIAPLLAKIVEIPEKARPAEAPKEALQVRVTPPAAVKTIEAPPSPEVSRRNQPIAPEPAKPAPPRIATGVFPGSPLLARTEEPSRSVQATGFEGPAAQAPQLKVSGPKVGAFEQAATTSDARPGTDRPVNAVASAGFGGPLAASPSRSTTRSVTDSGFGNNKTEARSQAADQPRGEIQQSGFGETRPVQPPKTPALKSQPVDTSVEILFKPTPTYTDEARALKLEGDVVLDVQFTASGSVNVLGVVRGLGHGLDEAAAHAAEQIRFKPAKSGGQAVDFRTTVHIVFRLA